MNTRKLFSRIGFGYVIFFVISVAAQLLIMLGLGVVSGRSFMGLLTTEVIMLLSQIAMYVCAFPVLYLWMSRLPSWKKQQVEKLSAVHVLLLLIFCFGVTYIGNIIGQILMFLVGLITKGGDIVNPVEDIVGQLSPLSLFFYVVIIAPLMEELVFRKLLIDRVIAFGQLPAMIVSGLAFGLFHGNFYQFFYACSLGMVFAYIYSRTGTIWYGVMIHAAINFVGGFLAALLLDGMSSGSMLAMAGTLAMGLLMAGTIIASVVLFFMNVTKVKFFRGWSEISGAALFKQVMTAPGVWAYLIVCVVMFIAM